MRTSHSDKKRGEKVASGNALDFEKLRTIGDEEADALLARLIPLSETKPSIEEAKRQAKSDEAKWTADNGATAQPSEVARKGNQRRLSSGLTS